MEPRRDIQRSGRPPTNLLPIFPTAAACSRFACAPADRLLPPLQNRQRDDRQERLDERIDDVQEQSHEGETDPGLGKTEGLDAGNEERGNRDGD